MRRTYAIGFGVAALLFVVLRLSLLWRFPPFYDEVFYSTWAYEGAASPSQRFISMTIGYQPLFSWLGMIGVWAGLAPLTAVRVVSAVAGGGTVVMTGLIAKQFGGVRTALTACVLAAIVPFFVVHDSIGILDPLVAALVSTSIYLQIRFARRPALADALLLGMALGAGVLTKPTSYVALALLPFGLLLFDWSPEGRIRRLARWAGGIVVALGIAGAMYSVMKASPLWHQYVREGKVHTEGAAQGETAHTISSGLAHPWHWISLNFPDYSSDIWGYVTWSILLAALIGLVVGFRRQPRLTAFVFLWFVVCFGMVVLLSDLQVPRYLLAGIPALLVLAAVGAVATFDWLMALPRSREVRLGIVAFAAAVLLVPAFVFDADVVVAPATATYPGFDESQYVTGGAALEPYKALEKQLRSISQGRAMTIALGDFTSQWWQLEFRNDPSIRLVRATAPPLCTSLYAIETAYLLPARTDGLAWKQVEVYPRPHNGTVTTLYESAVPYKGKVVTTPDELRALIGGTDANYDAFGKAHPCIDQWEQAWYTLHPPS